MIQGFFSPSIFFKIGSWIIASSLFLIYVIARELGHQPPIPQTYISQCAGHYPQFIIFRISTISGSVLVVLGWLTNHFFLKTVAREQAFHISKYHPQVGMIMGIMGGISLMASTANIDTGIRNHTWHQHCAAAFFLFSSLALFHITYISYIAFRKLKAISTQSMLTKALLCLLLVIQAGISWKYGALEGLQSDIGNIIQWTYSLTVAAYFGSMGSDVKSFKFVYELMPSDD